MIETGLSGRVVIITGAAAGIGRATALRFAREGCKVAAWDVNEDATLAGEIEQAGGEALIQRVDVTSAESIAAATSAVKERWGAVWALVNNAGVLRDQQLVKWKDGELLGTMPDDVFDSVINVNLRGVFLCTRAVAPLMIAGGGGVILNASSVVGLYGNFGQTNYVASKAGVIGMTKVWARELGRRGITVNAVAPGFVATDMTKGMPEKVLQEMVARVPVGRIGQAEDIAHAYLFLASDEAGYINGHVLSVDGGVVVGT